MGKCGESVKKTKAFLVNTALLTATALLMRTVGLSFSVYLSARIGTAGMGLYQLILSVYTLCVTVSTSGVNLASTRMVAEALGGRREDQFHAIMRRCLSYSIFFGGCTAVALFLGADYVGNVWLADSRTILSLRLLSLSMPFLSMCSAMAGYFTAVRRVFKNACVQVAEQVIRIVLTVIGLTLTLRIGIDYACAAIIGGGTAAELCSFLMTYLLYRLDVRRYHRKRERSDSRGLTKKMLGISIPVAFSAYARSGLVTIEHLLIPRGLRKSGISSDTALSAYGMIQGMALPVILFPAALLTSFAGLIVPELAERKEQGKTGQIERIVGRVFQLTLMFAIGVSGIFFFFAEDFGRLLYNNADTVPFIQILAPLIPVMYLDTAVDGMLKGLGEQVSSMRYNIIDASVSVLLVWFLLPRYAIAGYLVTIYVTEMLNAFLSANRLIKVTKVPIKPCSCILGPIFAIFGGCMASQLLSSALGISALSLTIKVLITILFYLAFLLLSHSLTKEDVRWIFSAFRG